MHCPSKKKVITNGETTETKDITLQSKDSLISRKTKWTESDTFNSSLCRLLPFHLPYVKAMSLVGPLPNRALYVVQPNSKVMFTLSSRAMNGVWPVNTF